MIQPELFSGANAYGEPLTAAQVGKQAAQACRKKAEERGWDSKGAAVFILRYLREHGPTPGEQLVDLAKAAGYVPHKDKAFGGVFGGLKKSGSIREHSYVRRRKGHATAGGIVWEVVT